MDHRKGTHISLLLIGQSTLIPNNSHGLLLYQETLFFKKNGLFGKECTRISQTIDLGTSTINNSIEFLGERSFNVDGTITIDTERPQRVNFQFTGALLTVPPIGLPLPPVGKVSDSSTTKLCILDIFVSFFMSCLQCAGASVN